MTNERPYRKALSEKAAREELRKCAGSQFDPGIVAEFIRMLEEMKGVSEEEQDSALESNVEPQKDIGGLQNWRVTDDNRISSYTKFVINENKKIISIDDSFEEITGYGSGDLDVYNLSHYDLVPIADRNDFIVKTEEQLRDKGETLVEHHLVRKDGAVRNVMSFVKNIFNSVTREAQSYVVLADIEKTNAVSVAKEKERESIRRSIEKWEENARKDSLTDIYNRVAFANEVETALLNEDKEIVFIIMDVDKFKEYNDEYGHLAGDKLLQIVSKALKDSICMDGFAGRLGGDEFAAVIIQDKGILSEDLKKRVELVWKEISSSLSTMDKYASVSMGAVATTVENRNFHDLYKGADKMLYEVKKYGRNSYKTDV